MQHGTLLDRVIVSIKSMFTIKKTNKEKIIKLKVTVLLAITNHENWIIIKLHISLLRTSTTNNYSNSLNQGQVCTLLQITEIVIEILSKEFNTVIESPEIIRLDEVKYLAIFNNIYPLKSKLKNILVTKPQRALKLSTNNYVYFQLHEYEENTY